MLETIRPYGEEKLAASGSIDAIRDRHARYYAGQAVAHWELWDGPDQSVALDWLDVELANLRAAFRWAADRADLVTATAVASHATMLGWALQHFEPVGWAQEILPAVITADVPQLPRLYTAASLCCYAGRPDDGLAFARAAVALETDARYDAFENRWSSVWQAYAHVYAGRLESALAILAALAEETGPGHIYGGSQTRLLAHLGRSDEAMAIAADSVSAARERANPFLVAEALNAYGLACTAKDPIRALEVLREGLAFTRHQRLPFWERTLARDAARLEVVYGDLQQALTMYESAIDSFYQAGDLFNLAVTLSNLASSLYHLEHPEIAATICGTASRLAVIRGTLSDRLRALLGDGAYERFAAVGEAMQPAEAVRYARAQIELARQDHAVEGTHPPPGV
jgi:tetratricopeptide (TPR) repeat protein